MFYRGAAAYHGVSAVCNLRAPSVPVHIKFALLAELNATLSIVCSILCPQRLRAAGINGSVRHIKLVQGKTHGRSNNSLKPTAARTPPPVPTPSPRGGGLVLALARSAVSAASVPALIKFALLVELGAAWSTAYSIRCPQRLRAARIKGNVRHIKLVQGKTRGRSNNSLKPTAARTPSPVPTPSPRGGGLVLALDSMKTYAQIASRSVRITGHPHSGWRAADANDQDAQVLNFRFSISDDGNGNFLLAYSSLDNIFAADSWHETIDEACRVADEMFNIKRSDWFPRNAV